MNDDCPLSSQISILIDDVLEMDSISDKEKDEAILELIDEEDKKELKSLAQRVIEQLEIDTKEFMRIAEDRSYCKKLIEDDIPYTQEDFAKDFKKRLSSTIDPNDAVSWAFNKITEHGHNVDLELRNTVANLGDRQWTIHELLEFADKISQR